MPTSLMPRNPIFFRLFNEHAENALRASEALARLLADFTDLDPRVGEMRDIEHHGDELTHQIMRELNGTFVAPLDREDIIGLASRLDDMTDVCLDVAEMLLMYGVTQIRPLAVQQAQVLVAATIEVVGLISRLSKSGRDQEAHWMKVHSFEKDGDALHRAAIGELFDQTTDPAEIIRWKDIHGLIEVAIDRCEDVANIVETIVVKHK